ncbi:GTP-binding protein [Reinekea sp.]|uniref:CobW family GTP-binding protein n=1 Tax=Reinekea sp. TaxID=1970455 RepID=UPI002A806FDB|nr:GTP-binding protein [Reinekea sp.]
MMALTPLTEILTMLKQISTHLITGFLGAGKTTLLQQWLAAKPAHERWAILVNEFGAIGLDAALLNAASDRPDAQQGEVFIQEVAGGCLCCAAGVPLTVALNRLLKRAQPDRLFIEPTGLGHPKAVLAVLKGPLYDGVLAVQQTVTLVDARLISNPRYSEHPTFRQQLAIADRVVASKVDQYKGTELADLTAFLRQHFPHLPTPLLSCPEQPLALAALLAEVAEVPPATQPMPEAALSELRFKGPIGQALRTDWVCLQNQADGSYSIGWQFLASDRFDPQAVIALLNELGALRVKAWFNGATGSIQINRTFGVLNAADVTASARAGSVNRLELIFDRPVDAALLTRRMRACLLQ